MELKPSAPYLSGTRCPSKIGDRFAKDKIDDARRLTPEKRLLIALGLSLAAAILLRARSDRLA